MAIGPPTLQRLDDQIAWYDKRSRANQRVYQALKILEIAAAASIPVLAGLQLPAHITGGAGATIVVLEGVQQLCQFHSNWISYRSTCEALKHEKYLFLASAGPYGSIADPIILLAERIESLISVEHSKWVSASRHRAGAVESSGEELR